MKRNHSVTREMSMWTLTALAVVAAAACGGSTSKTDAPAPAATATAKPTVTPQAPQQIAQSFEHMVRTVKAVDFEQLVALLPEAQGWSRSAPRGEEISMGIPMSRAQAGYERDESSIDLEITDSAFNQVFLAPLATYLASGYSERTTEGYRKAAPVSGHPAFETWNRDARRAEVIIVVSNRFVVQATGLNLDNAEPVRALAQAVDFSQLAAMK
jgi:hypothetical protein